MNNRRLFSRSSVLLGRHSDPEEDFIQPQDLHDEDVQHADEDTYDDEFLTDDFFDSLLEDKKDVKKKGKKKKSHADISYDEDQSIEDYLHKIRPLILESKRPLTDTESKESILKEFYPIGYKKYKKSGKDPKVLDLHLGIAIKKANQKGALWTEDRKSVV